MIGHGLQSVSKGLAVGLAIFHVVAISVIAEATAEPKQTSKNIDPDFVTVGAGGFDVNDNETAGQFEIQGRLNNRLWFFKPHFGMFFTTESGFYGYAGVMTDIFFGGRFVASPSFAVGGSHEGDGKELGGTLEFRSAIELAYRFDDRSRLGIQVGHLSNAGIYAENPGTEFSILNYSIPTNVFSR
mgnify:FL=1